MSGKGGRTDGKYKPPVAQMNLWDRAQKLSAWHVVLTSA